MDLTINVPRFLQTAVLSFNLCCAHLWHLIGKAFLFLYFVRFICAGWAKAYYAFLNPLTTELSLPSKLH